MTTPPTHSTHLNDGKTTYIDPYHMTDADLRWRDATFGERLSAFNAKRARENVEAWLAEQRVVEDAQPNSLLLS